MSGVPALYNILHLPVIPARSDNRWWSREKLLGASVSPPALGDGPCQSWLYYITCVRRGESKARMSRQGKSAWIQNTIKEFRGLSLFIIIFESFRLCFHSPLTCTILSTPRARASHFRILYRTPGVNIAPLVLEAIEIAPLSPTPAPLLGSGEILELGLF